MAETTYHWCQLKNGNKHTCGYIEERGAVVGKHVEMVDLDGEFWEVLTVAHPGVPKSFVRENEKRFKAFQGSLKGGGIE